MYYFLNMNEIMRKLYYKPNFKSFAFLPLMLALVGSGLFFGCSDNEFEPLTDRDVAMVQLEDAWVIDPYRHFSQYKFTLSNKQIFQIPMPLSEIHSNASVVKYHISLHRLEYTTTYKGQEITASGLIILPISPEHPAPILSYHHGPIFAERDVPSNLSNEPGANATYQLLPALVLGANGFITFVPDYIGHGSSSAILYADHLYEPAANAVVDMLLAGREFLRQKEVEFDEEKLFLAGYSSGGYVTMAAQKAIEENPQWKLPLTASAPGGGNYDLSLGLPEATVGGQLMYPNTLSRRLVAWNEYYWQRPLTDFFQEPYASHVSWLFNGELDFDETNEYLIANEFELMNHEFLMRLNNGQEKILDADVLANRLTNWQPKVPTRIYKGSYDQFDVAQAEYDIFLKKYLVNPDLVQLVPFDGKRQMNGAFPYLEAVVEWFNSF